MFDVAEGVTVDIRTRVLLMAIRQALLMILSALEDYLQMPRTKDGTHKRE
jgi:hypothetical protein